MTACLNCNTPRYYTYCLTCEARREELLERLQEDDGAATLAEIASMALHGAEMARERVWRVG